MSQLALFYESLSDAIRDAVQHLGGLKAVGAQLRPELSPDQADRGHHQLMHYVADECGYARPAPIDPQDEAAELKRQYIEATKQLAIIAQRMERFL